MVLEKEQIVSSSYERKAFNVSALSTHEYILKVVPSVYEELNGQLTFSYQYTYAHKVSLNLAYMA